MRITNTTIPEYFKQYEKYINLYDNFYENKTDLNLGKIYQWSDATSVKKYPLSESDNWFQEFKELCGKIVSKITGIGIKTQSQTIICDCCQQKIPIELPTFYIEQSVSGTFTYSGTSGKTKVKTCVCMACLMDLSTQAMDQVEAAGNQEILNKFVSDRFVSHL